MLDAGNLMVKQEKLNNLCHQESWGLVKKAGINFEKSPIVGKLPLMGAAKGGVSAVSFTGGELVRELGKHL